MYIVEMIDNNSSVKLNGFTNEAIKAVLRTGKSIWHHKELQHEIHKLSYSPLFECTIEPKDLLGDKGLLLETLQQFEKYVRSGSTFHSFRTGETKEFYGFHTIQIKEQK